MATEGMRLTGPTSRRAPVRARNRRLSPFEGFAVLFRGCGAPVVREWVAQCRKADTGLTTQCRIVAGMASPGGLAEQRRDMTPRHVGGTACARRCQSINVPVGGAGTGAAGLTRGGVQPSSEVEPHPRGRLALERSETSPEGASSPRARRTSPEGASSPRARQSFVSAVLCPSSEAEFRPWVAGPTFLVGHWGHQGCLCFAFYERKWVFPGFLGDPYGCP
jgi:hypothetical protein